MDASKSISQSPYQLNMSQTTQACKVLLKTIREHKRKTIESKSKPDLLEAQDAEEQAVEAGDIPVWLIVTTKRHIVDKARLKPNKISLPHSIHSTTPSTICLITADPQRLYKDAVNHTSFPSELRHRITRVIGLEKLKAKYKSFESRRQLLAEHDIFLADSRIVTYLPKTLGKTFYQTSSKRPTPVELGGDLDKGPDGRKSKLSAGEQRRRKENGGRGVATPASMAREINKALSSALVHLAPGVSTAVRVARAGFTPEMCTQNIQAVIDGMVSKIISSGWKNIRAMHVKGPNTIAFPVWLADELWLDDADVLEEKKVVGKKKKSKIGQAGDATKRISGADQSSTQELHITEKKSGKRKFGEHGHQEASKVVKKAKKTSLPEETASEIAYRKEKVKKAKVEAKQDLNDEIV